jgi:pimeloyl-ACP methyl ester carboxylesterase
MAAWLLRLVGVLLLLTAIAVPLTRAPDRPVQTLVARWAPPPSDFIDVKGQIVHLRDEGPRSAALTVVLLHGTSASLHTWEGWVKVLARHARVITLDLPGYGLTGPFTGAYVAGGYRGDNVARLVIDVLDALGVERFAIGGNSYGGEISWRVASLVPDRVLRLILVCSGGARFESQSLPLGWHIARLPVLGALSEHFLPRALVAQGLATAYADPGRVSPELVDRYYELTLREGNRRALGERLRQLERGADIDRLAKLQLPTLILWGRLDRIVPLAVADVFRNAIVGSQLVVFDDLGHVPQEEDPARTVEPVIRFLGLG